MAWSLGGIVVHPGNEEDERIVTSLYTFQHVLDAAVEDISFYGAGSQRRSIAFVLDENVNSNAGFSTLQTAVKTDANVALVSDQGAEGNYRILSFRARRLQALNKTYPVYKCSAELVSVSV